jgi:hypothetical protein
MNTIKRHKCAITNTNDLETMDILSKFPVFMGCSIQDESADLKHDLEWKISKSSGLIQLGSLLPLNVLYAESHGSGCSGELWNDHHNSFAKFIYKERPCSVFEIGGLHGILAIKYEKMDNISWTILEPNPAPIKGANAKFIKGFFDDKYQYSGSFDTVVHSHLFEHIYEPDEFMRDLSNFMVDGNNLLFSVPNMQVMLEKYYTNCLNFEHTVFLTEPYIEYLLSKYNFRLVRKEYFMEDHSIFYQAIKDQSITPRKLPNGLYQKNKELYHNYISYYKNLIIDLNKKIMISENKIYLFGAHIFSQYLIGVGLNTDRIDCLLDNDSNKQGKRLYGTTLSVRSPKILKNEKSPIIILKAGVYNDEIKKDILDNINGDAEFWE